MKKFYFTNTKGFQDSTAYIMVDFLEHPSLSIITGIEKADVYFVTNTGKTILASPFYSASVVLYFWADGGWKQITEEEAKLLVQKQ